VSSIRQANIAAIPMPIAWKYIFPQKVSNAGGNPAAKHSAPITAVTASVDHVSDLSERWWSWA